MPLPIEFLLDCSDRSCHDFQLSALNRAANLRKNIRTMEAEAAQLEAEALLAQWLSTYRIELLSLGCTTHPFQKTLNFKGYSLVGPKPVLDAVNGALANRKKSR